jgi:hypothetical protein
MTNRGFPSRVARFVLVQTYQNGKNIPNDHKVYQVALKYEKWPQTTPNGHEIYQHFPFKDPPKYTQFGIFGLKEHQLATLFPSIKPSLVPWEKKLWSSHSLFVCWWWRDLTS